MNDQIEQFRNLNEQLKTLSEKKIRLEEQYKAKKEALTNLIVEIKAKGYDPKKLGEVIKEKEKELNNSIEEFKKELEKVSAELTEIEGEN
jgi:uncharacterized protein (UPF0335 family)